MKKAVPHKDCPQAAKDCLRLCPFAWEIRHTPCTFGTQLNVFSRESSSLQSVIVLRGFTGIFSCVFQYTQFCFKVNHLSAFPTFFTIRRHGRKKFSSLCRNTIFSCKDIICSLLSNWICYNKLKWIFEVFLCFRYRISANNTRPATWSRWPWTG